MEEVIDRINQRRASKVEDAGRGSSDHVQGSRLEAFAILRKTYENSPAYVHAQSIDIAATTLWP